MYIVDLITAKYDAKLHQPGRFSFTLSYNRKLFKCCQIAICRSVNPSFPEILYNIDDNTVGKPLY